jgi:hypothetical protein
MAERKMLDLKTLRDDGYLQEVNRQFFHPLGLALAVDSEFRNLYVWDERDDPEGFTFADDQDLKPKADRLQEIVAARIDARVKALGYWRQDAVPEHPAPPASTQPAGEPFRKGG